MKEMRLDMDDRFAQYLEKTDHVKMKQKMLEVVNSLKEINVKVESLDEDSSRAIKALGR